MWCKRLIFGTLLLGPSLALASDKFDITMDVVGSGESYDEAVVNQIELPFGRQSAEDRKLQPAALSELPLDQLEDIVRERLGGGASGGTERPGGGLGDVESLDALDGSLDLLDAIER